MTATRRLPQPPLLVVTDRRQARGPLETMAEAAFAAGCRWLLLREKDLHPVALRQLASRLAALSRSHGARLSIAGDISLAAEVGADGVHLPRDGDVAAARSKLRASALIGLSAHDRAEAERAAAAGADYVTLSPIFPSESKPGYGPALGLEPLARMAEALPIPVIALGGVTADKAEACLTVGAGGVAVMGEVMRAEDPGAIVAALLGRLAALSDL